MNLRELKQSIGELPLRELVKLGAWLRELIDAIETRRHDRAVPKRAVTRDQQTPSRTYQLEGVRCGKENCKCAKGHLHGPYWYAYWTEGGKTRSQYVGKKLPRGVKKSSSQGA